MYLHQQTMKGFVIMSSIMNCFVIVRSILIALSYLIKSILNLYYDWALACVYADSAPFNLIYLFLLSKSLIFSLKKENLNLILDIIG